MRAVVRDEYGGPDVLKIEEIDKPELVDDGVLGRRVRAAALNPTDYVLMRDSCVRDRVAAPTAAGGGHRRLEPLLELAALAQDGSVTPLVDRTYPLTETPAAMRYLMARHPRGKVVMAP